MPASDWLLREPRGIVHGTMFVWNRHKPSFVLPACWRLIYGDVKTPEPQSRRRRRLRRNLRPVRAKQGMVTCMDCIAQDDA